MSKFRNGDPVLVHAAAAHRARKPGAREAVFRGEGRDSGGPWTLVEYTSGVTELVHPDRISKKDKTA